MISGRLEADMSWYSVLIECGERVGHRCPCCKRLTLKGRGMFESCPVCIWEDDGQDDHDADVVRGGPNRTLSLSEARANYLTYGAADQIVLPYARPPTSAEH